jgi:hypothetical protein
MPGEKADSVDRASRFACRSATDDSPAMAQLPSYTIDNF